MTTINPQRRIALAARYLLLGGLLVLPMEMTWAKPPSQGGSSGSVSKAPSRSSSSPRASAPSRSSSSRSSARSNSGRSSSNRSSASRGSSSGSRSSSANKPGRTRAEKPGRVRTEKPARVSPTRPNRPATTRPSSPTASRPSPNKPAYVRPSGNSGGSNSGAINRGSGGSRGAVSSRPIREYNPGDIGTGPRRQNEVAGGPDRPAKPSGDYGGDNRRYRGDYNHGYYNDYHYYRYRHRHYYGFGPFGWGLRYGWGFGLGYYFPYGYDPYYYGPLGHVYSPRGYHRGGYGDYDASLGGALDLDVRPEKAEIFIDGNRIGVADQYDGFPSYLWLEKGTYDVVIYKEGYETIARQYTIYPGVVIDVKDRMVPGKALLPEELISTSTKNRDERLRRDRERAAYAAGQPGQAPQDPGVQPQRGIDVTPSPQDPDSIGRLVLRIVPGDAAVYLDGHFLGPASEIGQLSAGMVVEPGEHVLELVRPGFETERIPVTIPPGEQVDLELQMQRR